MEKIERAWFIDRMQLLLMLSLMDNRPVMGFSLGDVSQIPVDTWKLAALSLIQEGRLISEENRLTVAPEWYELLSNLKDAGQVLALYGKKIPAKLVYLGAQPIVLEVHSPTEYRIRQIDRVSAEWLAEEMLLSNHMAEEEEADRLLSCDEHLIQRLKLLEKDAPRFGTPPSVVGQREDVCAIADRYLPSGGLSVRWIWLNESFCDVILRQDAKGCTAAIDTQRQRETVLGD